MPYISAATVVRDYYNGRYHHFLTMYGAKKKLSYNTLRLTATTTHVVLIGHTFHF
jgi:hypothetical protein